jgi:hypothetical protein
MTSSGGSWSSWGSTVPGYQWKTPGGSRFVTAQYRWLLRCFGKKNEGKAIFALAHTLLVVLWHVLLTGCEYDDLGGDYFERRNDADARERYLVRELEKLGHVSPSSRPPEAAPSIAIASSRAKARQGLRP